MIIKMTKKDYNYLDKKRKIRYSFSDILSERRWNMDTEVRRYGKWLETKHIARFKELPGIDIYRDQLISYIAQQLDFVFEGHPDRKLTTAMVNNYVKAGVLPPTTKKKYNKEHIAVLIITCVLKQIYTIPQIKTILGRVTTRYDIACVYDSFCDELEKTLKSVFAKQTDSKGTDIFQEDILVSSIQAFAKKHYVEKTIEAEG